MLVRSKLNILLHCLTLVLLGPSCEASSLGLAVHVVPLDSNGGKTVRAHFSAIASGPCSSLSGLCAEGEDCLVHTTLVPFKGTKPDTEWCVHQWQKTVPSDYTATIRLGSSTEFYVSMNAKPFIRPNSGRLNHPAFVGLPPPLRARVKCPHHFHLSVKDLDGDRVRCRYARPDEGECLKCTQHPFIELEEGTCMLTFTGEASAGQYFIHLMVEDLIPGPKISKLLDNKPLSSVPVHLSLTVEESTTSCSEEPVTTGDTPKEDATLFVLPYQEVSFDVSFTSETESVSEIAVVGPPELYRVGFKSVGPLAAMNMAWIRSENNLTHLLPICFVVNTKSLQSEPRCVWLYQREMSTLPAGTVLKCEETEMALVLPVTSLTNIDLSELQLNSPDCPVTYNSTHLTARISLDGCGTKRVHSGSELVYTNTLQSVRPYTMVSHRPSLVLPLACRIPGVEAKGPHYGAEMPLEKEVFGNVSFWMEIHLPGEGPMSEFTRDPKFRFLPRSRGRVRREVITPSESNTIIASTATNSTDDSNSTSGAIGSKIKKLDLHLMSNCSIERAEMIVSNCIESEMEDFVESHAILEQGCSASNSTVEIITTNPNSRIYRLDLSQMETNGSMMYLRCTVNLCITTLPSLKCPDLCAPTLNKSLVVDSVFTASYTMTSGPVSLVVTTPAPTTTVVVTTARPAVNADTTTTAQATTTSTTSHAPEQATTITTGVVLTTISIFLHVFLH